MMAEQFVHQNVETRSRMNTYEELREALGKLKRNESQMTGAQKKQYKKQLDALKHKAAGLANQVARDFLLMGIRIRKDDGDEAVERIKAIIVKENGNLKKAMKALLATYSMDKFFAALLPSQTRIFYEGYGPYLARHCVPVKDGDGDARFSYYNDIIDMYWAEEWSEWKRKGEWCVTIMLPPVMEMIRKRYQEEMAELGESLHKHNEQ